MGTNRRRPVRPARRPSRAESDSIQEILDELTNSLKSESKGGPQRTEYYINDQGVYDARPASHKNRQNVQDAIIRYNESMYRARARKYYKGYWLTRREQMSPQEREDNDRYYGGVEEYDD